VPTRPPAQPGASPAVRLRALVVEDDAPLARAIADYLTRDGFDVEIVANGETALEWVSRSRPDVVLLDLMLPGIDGIETCRRIRTFSDAYVVMLTARGGEVDKLVGLSVGADDYVTKPFSPRELVARVRAMLRRPRAGRGVAQPPRRFGDLTIDPGAREVRVGTRVVELTPTEFDLLDTLSARPRLALSRGQLRAQVWGSQRYGDDHVVDVHLANLRRKLGDDPKAPRYLLTVRGVGYRMGAPG
jgi:DNA-binding response OmpR family regulator